MNENLKNTIIIVGGENVPTPREFIEIRNIAGFYEPNLEVTIKYYREQSEALSDPDIRQYITDSIVVFFICKSSGPIESGNLFRLINSDPNNPMVHNERVEDITKLKYSLSELSKKLRNPQGKQE